MNNKITESYLRSALKNCPLGFKKKLKSDLYSSLCDFAEENPDAGESEIVSRFGLPDQFATEYIASLDDNKKVELFTKNKFIKRAIAIGVAVVIIIVTVGVSLVTYAVLDSEEEYYYYGIEIQEF